MILDFSFSISSAIPAIRYFAWQARCRAPVARFFSCRVITVAIKITLGAVLTEKQPCPSPTFLDGLLRFFALTCLQLQGIPPHLRHLLSRAEAYAADSCLLRINVHILLLNRFRHVLLSGSLLSFARGGARLGRLPPSTLARLSSGMGCGRARGTLHAG